MLLPSLLNAFALLLLSKNSPVVAINSIEVQSQDFADSKTGTRFEVLGVDYQPGGEEGYDPGSGTDPLSNSDNCLRDAALMQILGLNTIRVYNLDPDVDHDDCASIFNAVGVYMICDVNSPLPNQSISSADPASSYNLDYLNRTFAIIDAFRNYPNTLGFFSANELINNDATAGPNPPYIRAVTRDLKQYMAARGGRAIPVGYSAADVDDILTDTSMYVQCRINGNSDDMSRSDFFGLNSYSWCGPQATFQTSGYDDLISDFAKTTIPVFFSEYGCNHVLPRTFPEVSTLYSEQMSVFSGGLVYQWTQEENNFGLVQVNNNGSVSLLSDYNALQMRFLGLDQTFLQSQNATAKALVRPKCSSDLITNSNFNNSFTLPSQPKGVAQLIKSGVGGRVGNLVPVTKTKVSVPVYNTTGEQLSSLAIKVTNSANKPSAVPTVTTGSSSTPTSKSAASMSCPGHGLFYLTFVLLTGTFHL
ncbi:MAG: hypothetical protein M1828_007403 [Chrysothrix sp. TS-e1954]|nr:MAG: hypothetical protein M1828_007403 [Chrysothrix sp. TS-e1954]